MNLHLTKARIQDIPTLISIEKEVSGTKLYSGMLTKREWTSVLRVFTVLLKKETYLIELDNQTVGEVSYEMKGAGHAYISGLVIRPAFQRKGIGKEAMRMILKELDAVKKIDLVTHPENIPAIKLYESLGFHIGPRIENYFGDGEPRVKMILEK